MKKEKHPKQVGRDDLAAMLAGDAGVSVDTARRVLQSLFGVGGSGASTGGRAPGVIEEFLRRGSEVNIRGFGCFRRSQFKAHKTRIDGVPYNCRDKLKLSFRASLATDIIIE